MIIRPSLFFRFFGTFSIEKDEHSVAPPRYQKARALLAFLALEQGWHSREFLADFFWPNEAIATGRENLRRMLFQLKPLSSFCQLETTRDAVSLFPSDAWDSDFSVFSDESEPATQVDLRRRLELYRGHFLQGFNLDGAPSFEQWCERRRAESQTRFVALGLHLAELTSRSDGLGPAIACARRVVQTAPWSEAGWQALIGLLARHGRFEEARSELEQCRVALRDELGIEPAPETLALLRLPNPNDQPVVPAISVDALERRRITVLFCELMVPGEDDAESVAESLDRPQRECERILLENGAHIVPSPGGGLLAYFGFPLAREGDARRAARAALMCSKLSTATIQVRAGLHSGVILSQRDQVLPDKAGLITNQAVRICGMAAPQEILMSSAARQLLAHCCKDAPCRPLDDSLTGRRLDLFRLLMLTDGDPRWGGDTRLIGRERELSRLVGLQQQAVTSPLGTLVLLIGEAGGGKTRILREFTAQNSVNGLPRPVVFHCMPEFSDKFFHPFLPWLNEILGQPARCELDQIRSTYRLSEEEITVVASLLGLDAQDEPVFRHWMAGKWQQLAVSAIISVIRQATPAGATIVIEDMHWADHSTRELCIAMVNALPGRMILATSRPGFAFAELASTVTEIVLPLLEPEAARELASAATAMGALDAEILDRVVTLGAGIPLFIEEIARELVTNGGILPLTLHDILQARLDAAGDYLSTLRHASAIGTVFDVAILALVEECSPNDMARVLDSLVEMGLLSRLEQGGFSFRHELLRQAAYHSQSRAAMVAVHRKIISAMMELNPQAMEQDPGLFAWHHRQAGALREAIRCHVAAGKHALARSLYREANAHHQAALGLLADLPDDIERAQLEIEIRLSDGIPLLALYGYGSRQATENYRRTQALAEPLGNDPRLFLVYWGLWLGSSSLEDFLASKAFGIKLVQLGDLAENPVWQSHAHYALGNSLFCLGDFAAAAEQFELGIAIYRQASDHLNLGEDAQVTNLSFLSWAHWYSGRHEDALDASRRAIAHARQLAHPYSMCFALVFAAILHRLRREGQLAETLAAESLELADRYGMVLWQAASTVVVNWARVAQGRHDAMDGILRAVSMMGPVMGGIETMFLAHLVEACQLANRPDMGLDAVERGLAVADQKKDWHYVAEFQRLKAEFMHSLGATPQEARYWLERAAQTALDQASPSLILRVALSRARLALDHADPSAPDMLSTAFAAFEDGADTGDLREACALLDVLT